MLPFWVRHYRTFCDRVIVYLDVDTDDGSDVVATAEGAEVRPYRGSGKLDDVEFIRFAQEHYLEARGQADWVIWTDADEILYHPFIGRRLDTLRDAGVTVPQVTGYSMIADAPPCGAGQIYDEIRSGFESAAYSKACIFRAYLNVMWGTGKHTANYFGGPILRDHMMDPLKLLHYRWLGEQHFLARNARNLSRLSQRNIDNQLGWEIMPGAQGEHTPAWYAERVASARDCL